MSRRRGRRIARDDRIKMVLREFERLHGCEPITRGCCVVSLWMAFIAEGLAIKRV